MLKLAIILLTTYIISILLTGFILRYTLKKQIIDFPKPRSSHNIPTPRGGGVGFVLLFILITCWFAVHKLISLPLFLALSAGILIALMGGLDDVFSLRPIWRGIIQLFVATLAVYWLNGRLDPTIESLLVILTIAWSINLYNFMDGIDGLAAAEGVFIAVSAGTSLLLAGALSLSSIFFLLATLISGFLFWNWPPAKIFMGDVGSGYLGYIFSVLAIYTINTKLLPIGFWLTISLVFLGDATLTVIKRVLQKKCWYEAHREHAYQRLVQYGFSHKTITMGIMFFNFFVSLPMSFIIFFYPGLDFYLVTTASFIYFILWMLILNQRQLA